MSKKLTLERGMRRLADDELMHWKYVKRVRGKNGKYRYYYDNNTGTSKNKADVKPSAKYIVVCGGSHACHKPTEGKHDAAIAAVQASVQNMPMYQLKHGNLIQKVVAGYKIVKQFIDKKLLINLKRTPRLDLYSLHK